MSERLSRDALRRTGRSLAVDPAELSTGIVHLGLGAFHRAHQAAYTLDAVEATGDTRWGICGVSLRSDAVRRALAPQDLLYSLTERGEGARGPRVVPLLREVLLAGEDSAAVVARTADPRTHVVTLTVTEKGYHLRDGGLDRTDPAVRADLPGGAHERAPRTPVALLARGLAARHAAGTAPVTVVCCDNLPGNGSVLRRLVGEFLAAAGEDPALLDATAFPDSAVDRITPATTPADLDDVAARLGLRDEAAVVAEPFAQWVLGEEFSGPRPRWEEAGALLVADVAPFERAKLRVLNGSHTLLATLGALQGVDTVAQAVADPVLRAAALRMVREDVLPTLQRPPGLDLPGYAEQVLRRFANPALAHTTAQVASDGSQKLPPRVLDVVRERLAAGAMPRWSALAVAAWLLHAERSGDALADPLAGLLADRLRCAAAGPVDALLGVEEVFGTDVAAHPGFRAAVEDWYGRLRREGVAAIEQEVSA